MARAMASGIDGEQLLILRELFATAGMVGPGNPFRDQAVAAGLGAGDARFGGFAARVVALQRLRRLNGSELVPAAQRAGRLGDIAYRSAPAGLSFPHEPPEIPTWTTTIERRRR